jgi:hypothetical protein
MRKWPTTLLMLLAGLWLVKASFWSAEVLASNPMTVDGQYLGESQIAAAKACDGAFQNSMHALNGQRRLEPLKARFSKASGQGTGMTWTRGAVTGADKMVVTCYAIGTSVAELDVDGEVII